MGTWESGSLRCLRWDSFDGEDDINLDLGSMKEREEGRGGVSQDYR